MDKFIGFDQPKLNESYIEVQKDGKNYLSFYHECNIIEKRVLDDSIVVKLKKIYAGHKVSGEIGTIYTLTFTGVGSLRRAPCEDYSEEDLWEFEATSPTPSIILGAGSEVLNFDCDRVILNKE